MAGRRGPASFRISPSAGRAARVGRRAWLFALLLWQSALRQAEALDLQWQDLNFTAAAPTTKSRKGTGGPLPRGSGPSGAGGRLPVGAQGPG